MKSFFQDEEKYIIYLRDSIGHSVLAHAHPVSSPAARAAMAMIYWNDLTNKGWLWLFLCHSGACARVGGKWVPIPLVSSFSMIFEHCPR